MSALIDKNWPSRAAAAALAVIGSLFTAGGSLGLAEHYAHAATNAHTPGYYAAGVSRRAVCPVATDASAARAIDRTGFSA